MELSQIPTWLGGKNEEDIRGICTEDFEDMWAKARAKTPEVKGTQGGLSDGKLTSCSEASATDDDDANESVN